MNKHTIIWVSLILFCLSTDLPGQERKFLQTGNWYPSSAPRLNSLLQSYFKEIKKESTFGKIRAIISPHAGLAYSGKCAARAFKQIEREEAIRRIILLGVSHSASFYGAAVSDFTANVTPLGTITVDRDITKALAEQPLIQVNNRIMQNEHSIENQLPFLQHVLNGKRIKIVPILFGRLEKGDIAKIASIIKDFVDDQTVIVASTDFTHYGRSFGYTPFRENIPENLRKLDLGMIKQIKQFDLNGFYDYKRATGITMCGFIPVAVLMKIFNTTNHQVDQLEYLQSGELTGDYNHCVTYASLLISNRQTTSHQPQGRMEQDLKLTDSTKEDLLSLARRTLEFYFQNGTSPTRELLNRWIGVNPAISQIVGVFVTLKKGGQLRGCIGNISGSEAIYRSVSRHAILSAVKDPRFSPMRKQELDQVQIEISIMTPLKEISNYRRIRLGVDGVLLVKGARQAVFLPQVATETGWRLDQFLGQLSRKAGLSADAYTSPDTRFYIFQAQVFSEKEN